MNCIDIGTLQAFLDGELSLDLSAAVSDHLDVCDACTRLLSEAEAEEALVMPALAREFDSLVPTQRLWTKINEHIETEKRERPWYKKLEAFALTLLARPSFAVATAALLFVVIGAGFFLSRQPAANDTVATRKSAVGNPAATVIQAAPPEAGEKPDIAETAEFNDMPKVAPRHRAIRAAYTTASAQPVPARSSSPAAAVDLTLQNYESTIAGLSRSLQGQKDSVMAVQERIAFERDMALVNNTIAKMRAQVRKDPNDASARQVLYSSYQNKIDLLNSVSQKQELVASLR